MSRSTASRMLLRFERARPEPQGAPVAVLEVRDDLCDRNLAKRSAGAQTKRAALKITARYTRNQSRYQ